MFIDEPLRVFLIAFHLFRQFLDCFRNGFLWLVDRLFAGFRVALDDHQTGFP
jgi:hypothetical protein